MILIASLILLAGGIMKRNVIQDMLLAAAFVLMFVAAGTSDAGGSLMCSVALAAGALACGYMGTRKFE